MKGSFEVIGYINKEELVSGLSHSILKNTFVIDISHPFPGYNREKLSKLTKQLEKRPCAARMPGKL